MHGNIGKLATRKRTATDLFLTDEEKRAVHPTIAAMLYKHEIAALLYLSECFAQGVEPLSGYEFNMGHVLEFSKSLLYGDVGECGTQCCAFGYMYVLTNKDYVNTLNHHQAMIQAHLAYTALTNKYPKLYQLFAPWYFGYQPSSDGFNDYRGSALPYNNRQRAARAIRSFIFTGNADW